jgi:serine/threonine protein kinase
MSDNYRALPKGTRLLDYVIDGVLGQGSFGITYLATEIATNIKVAIKEYYPREFAIRDTTLTVKASGSKDDRDNFKWGLERFRAESRVIALFQHPNIVGVKRFFNANGTAYLVMEYCDGIPLDEQLRQVGALSQKELINLINPILDALELIHNSKYLHRDVKPGNIYIRSDGTPILLDFGAARQDLLSHSRSITSLATPGYAPYEQYSTDSQQGPSADIYGFSATLYRVVVGKRPIESPTRIMNDTLEKSQDLVADKYDQNILRAIDSGLALRPNDRPHSISEWRKIFGPMISEKNSLSQKIVSPQSEYIRVDFEESKSQVHEPINIYLMEGKSTTAKVLTLVGLGLFLIIVAFGYVNYLETNKPHIAPKPVAIPLASNPPQSSEIKSEAPPSVTESTLSNGLPACPKSASSSIWTDCVGTYTFPAGIDHAGDSYTGPFKKGFFHGKGVYRLASGARYEGNLSYGKKEGYGTYFDEKGVVQYRGIWSDNAPINEVIITPDKPRPATRTMDDCTRVADYTKKSLPKILDSVTTWTTTSCAMGKFRPILTYWYEANSNESYSQSRINLLRESTKQHLCSSDTRSLLDGLDVEYKYLDAKTRRAFGSIYISLADCRK